MSQFIRTVLKFKGYILSLFPRSFHLFLGKTLGIFFFDILRVRRKVILSNLEIAFPEKKLSERISIGRASMISLGHTVIEYFLMLVFKKKWAKEWVVIEGLEHLDKAIAQGQGAFLLTLHLANGDFACAALAQRGYDLFLISKRAKQKWLDDVWFDLRAKLGVKFISHEKSSFDILRTLKTNGIVIWVLDQYMGPPSGVKTRFFGKETGTAQGLALFTERTRVPVIPCYSYRKLDGSFHMVFEKEIPLSLSSNREETLINMTQVYNDHLEQIVRLHPDQWMWIHRRWKKFG